MSTKIKTFSATSGFLENCKVSFAPTLTCIIGARGTCKSTLIESIRFAFSCDNSKIVNLIEPGGMIKETLSAGTIQCQIEAGDSEIVLEREIGAETRIYIDGVREHAEPDLLEKIEIYSQGDLQKIAEDDVDNLRLLLIDRPKSVKINKLTKEREEIARKLVELGPNIRNYKQQMQELYSAIAPTKELTRQLQEIEKAAPEISPVIEKQRILFENRNAVVEKFKGITGIRSEVVEQLPQFKGYLEMVFNLVSEIEKYSFDSAKISLQRAQAILKSLEIIVKELNSIEDTNIESSIEELKGNFEKENEEFYHLRKKEQEVNEYIKKRHNLSRQIEQLNKLSSDAELIKKKIDRLNAERKELREKLSEKDNEIYKLRINEISSINETYGETVFLTLETNTESSEYAKYLEEKLSGSRIRNQNEVALALAKSFPPSSLIDIIETGNGQEIANILGRDIGQMNRVVSHMEDMPDLYELEAIQPGTRLDITMYDEGEPKPVETLSKGQRATALLPLILRPLPYPLLFDQPEDDLDNSFIYKSLVEAIQKLKLERQLIFVTHNANIPVLGEADKIIVMDMETPKKAKPSKEGSVDERSHEILDLLEGGKDAFKKREEKYGKLIDE